MYSKRTRLKQSQAPGNKVAVFSPKNHSHYPYWIRGGGGGSSGAAPLGSGSLFGLGGRPEAGGVAS